MGLDNMIWHNAACHGSLPFRAMQWFSSCCVLTCPDTVPVSFFSISVFNTTVVDDMVSTAPMKREDDSV